MMMMMMMMIRLIGNSTQWSFSEIARNIIEYESMAQYSQIYIRKLSVISWLQ